MRVSWRLMGRYLQGFHSNTSPVLSQSILLIRLVSLGFIGNIVLSCVPRVAILTLPFVFLGVLWLLVHWVEQLIFPCNNLWGPNSLKQPWRILIAIYFARWFNICRDRLNKNGLLFLFISLSSLSHNQFIHLTVTLLLFLDYIIFRDVLFDNLVHIGFQEIAFGLLYRLLIGYFYSNIWQLL